MVDDLGKDEISGYSSKDIQTPNIDRIGKEGVKFQNAYATAPICSPSRAAILTGKYQQRYGFETQPMEFYPNRLQYALGKNAKRLGDWKIATPLNYPSKKDIVKQGIPPDQINIAEILKANGYKTGLLGKWHLGTGPEHHPNKRGFDYFYGFLGAFSLYTPKRDLPGYEHYIQDDYSSKYQWKMGRNKSASIFENDKIIEEKEYLTFAIRDRAIEFIDDNKDNSFFLTVSFNAPHVPFQAPKEYYDQFSHIIDKNRRVYLSMIKALDDAVGEVMNQIKKSGLENNTIVYFISDNGGASYTGATDNGELKGGKVTHFEGGINIPFMMKWPNKIPQNRVYRNPVSALDLFSTTLEACKVSTIKNLKSDGVNLLPFILNENNLTPHEKLYWRTDHIHCIRYDKWKLIMSTRDGWMHLYNLENDKSEKVDLKDFNEKEKAVLLQYFEEWNNELPQKYLWPRIMDRKFIIGDKVYYFPA